MTEHCSGVCRKRLGLASRRFRELRPTLCQRGVYRSGIAAGVRMAETQYRNVSADDCIGADCDWCGSRFAYDGGYPSGKFGAAAVYRVSRAVFRCDEFYDVHSCRNVSADGGFGGVAVFCGGILVCNRKK